MMSLQFGKPELPELDRLRVRPEAFPKAILAKCSDCGNRGLAPIGGWIIRAGARIASSALSKPQIYSVRDAMVKCDTH